MNLRKIPPKWNWPKMPEGHPTNAGGATALLLSRFLGQVAKKTSRRHQATSAASAALIQNKICSFLRASLAPCMGGRRPIRWQREKRYHHILYCDQYVATPQICPPQLKGKISNLNTMSFFKLPPYSEWKWFSFALDVSDWQNSHLCHWQGGPTEHGLQMN